MSFVKLDQAILDSSVWADGPTAIVWITCLLMSEPHTYDYPVPVMPLDDTKPTGETIPPGNYGLIKAAASGIIARARIMDSKAASRAMRALSSSDPESRSPEFEGRRIVRVPGGFVVLNYAKYRERDMTNAERQRRWKSKNSDKEKQKLTVQSNALPNGKVTDVDVDVDVEDVQAKALVLGQQPPRTNGHDLIGHEKPADCPHDAIVAAYHRLLPMLPQVREWTETRRTKLRARWREKTNRQSLEFWERFFGYVAKSDFLCGRAEPAHGRKVFLADLEWLITPANFVKIIEGRYENERPPPAGPNGGAHVHA